MIATAFVIRKNDNSTVSRWRPGSRSAPASMNESAKAFRGIEVPRRLGLDTLGECATRRFETRICVDRSQPHEPDEFVRRRIGAASGSWATV